ncbi:MAG: GNAT family N-acetyltransferase [Bacteroidales bacterium]|nr:GNAT family N-acetyltransferase [Bacteroidales bacterium]
MIIRDYKPPDFPKVDALWKETGIYTAERGDTPDSILRCNAQGGRFLVLEEELNNRIFGTSWLTWDGRRVQLHHFAILPSKQGLGYGRMLALESLAFAREKNSPVKLEVHRDNIPAIRLYLSLGFKVFDDYEVYMLQHDT